MPSSLATLLLALLTPVTTTIPTPQPQQQEPPTNPPLIQCTPRPPANFYIPPPTPHTCAFALRSLPSTPDIATFHAGNPPTDEYLLPTYRTYGSCSVQVELSGGHASEEGSWLQIGLVATQLGMACVDGEKMGGRTTVGKEGWIVVTVRESGRNSTAEEE